MTETTTPTVAISAYEPAHLYHLPGRDFQLLLGPQTGESDRMTMSLVTFPPHSRPELHRHPREEEQIYVLSGRGLFLTEDAEIPLEEGMALRVPVGIWHGSATTDESLRLLCMFDPPVVPGSYEPDDATG